MPPRGGRSVLSPRKRPTSATPFVETAGSPGKEQTCQPTSGVTWIVNFVRLFLWNFPFESFLILTGICLLGFGLNMTRREFNEIALAGLPIEGIPLCSVNPSIYYERSGVWVPECEPYSDMNGSATSSTVSAAYVLSLDSEDAEQAYLDRKRLLARHGIDLMRFQATDGRKLFGNEYNEMTRSDNVPILAWSVPGTDTVLEPGQRGYLTPGERGYMRSMYMLLEAAYRDPSKETVLVLDDDALFTCNFERDLSKLLAEPRCGGPKGVLLLGMSIWIRGDYPRVDPWTGGWGLFDEDRRMYVENTGMTSSCANTNSKTFGTFAVIYGRDTIPAILRWLESATVPFDHMFKNISEEGFPIRVAYPFIAIQDVRHASQIDQTRQNQDDMETRAQIHRWNLTMFCDTSGEPLTPQATTATPIAPDANEGGAAPQPVETDETIEVAEVKSSMDHDDLANDRVETAGEHTTYE